LTSVPVGGEWSASIPRPWKRQYEIKIINTEEDEFYLPGYNKI
jgi:hypothetical protein